MTRGGNVWFDKLGLSWTSPANQQTVEYLSTLCQELADMGFDEIVLDCAGYPNAGEVNVLATSDNRPENLTVPVSAFLERISGELKEKGALLSVQTTEDAVRGENTLSGVTSAGLVQYADRVWLPAPVKGSDYAAIFAAAGMEDTLPRLVVQNSFSNEGSWYR